MDADLFASAQSLVSALSNENVTHESGAIGVADLEKSLWEALGLSEDPSKDYDVVLTLTAAVDDAHYLGLKVRYVI